MRHRFAPLALLPLLALVPAPAAAQNVPVPKFEMGKPVAEPAPWSAEAKGSLLVTSGNTQTRNAVFGARGERRFAAAKLVLDGQIAYGRSNVLVPRLDPATPTQVVGFDRRTETTTNQWLARARGDRFFTENNAGYLLAQIAADEIAGKERFGGGQLGYSRRLVKNEQHEAVAELGYDFSFESHLGAAEAVQIHSARVFLGETLKLSDATGANVGLEALFNLNEENALNVSDRSNKVPAFKDTRLQGKVGLTTKLWENLSFAFGFTVRYDQNPALRPLPPLPAGAMLAPTLPPPFADRVDTLTEATLVFTLL